MDMDGREREEEEYLKYACQFFFLLLIQFPHTSLHTMP